MTALRLWTARYQYAGADRIDITRQGVDKAGRTGIVALGAPWAPSAKILWPAKTHLTLVDALVRRAEAMPLGEASAFVLTTAHDLLSKTEGAYRDLYHLEMQQSYRRHRAAWDALLARETATLVCFCPRREPGEGQRHHCHRHHLAPFLVACGAVDLGELELPPPANPSKPRPLPPLETRVAVSGCRPPPAGAPREHFALHREILADVGRTVEALPAGTVVVHGGAEGVDATAGQAARDVELAEEVVPPWYDAFGRDAPLVRNAYVATCPRLIAWPSGWGSGTQRAVELARKAGVEVDERRLG